MKNEKMKKNVKMKKGAPHSYPQLRGLRYREERGEGVGVCVCVGVCVGVCVCWIVCVMELGLSRYFKTGPKSARA